MTEVHLIQIVIFLANDIIGVGMMRLKGKKFTHDYDLFM
jgi:hypothetical protein